MTCPCCGLTSPHKNMGNGCIPALRARVAELEADLLRHRTWLLETEAERDRYRETLEYIRDHADLHNESMSNVAFKALNP